MGTEKESNKTAKATDSTDGLSRRHVLMTATVAAGALGAPSAIQADTFQTRSFGAPLVEVQVPAGVLTLEQKGAMIKGITDVVLGATKQAPDPAKRLFVQIFETTEGGWGVNVVQSDDFLFLTFFIYGADNKPTWYTAQLTLDASGNYNGKLYATQQSGGVGQVIQIKPDGTIAGVIANVPFATGIAAGHTIFCCACVLSSSV